MCTPAIAKYPLDTTRSTPPGNTRPPPSRTATTAVATAANAKAHVPAPPTSLATSKSQPISGRSQVLAAPDCCITTPVPMPAMWSVTA
jgi:hypothetical protein